MRFRFWRQTYAASSPLSDSKPMLLTPYIRFSKMKMLLAVPASQHDEISFEKNSPEVGSMSEMP
jgi:hypothetical protein